LAAMKDPRRSLAWARLSESSPDLKASRARDRAQS